MFCVSRGAAAQEIEAESAPGLGCIEIAERILALDLLALEELGHGLDLLPGLRHAPFARVAGVLPGLGESGVGEIVGPVIEVVAVAVDGDPIGLAVPGPDRRLQVIDIIVDIDLLLDPIRHLRRQALAADIALERGAHFKDVEVDRAGRDRLLQSRVVVGLSEVDPGNFRARIGLPRFQETAEQQVVQILVVQPHEGQFDALEFALLDIRLGRAEAELADLLPIGIGRRAFSHTRNLQHPRPQIVLRQRPLGERTESAGRAEGRRTGCSLEDHASVRPQPVFRIVPMFLHCETSLLRHEVPNLGAAFPKVTARSGPTEGDVFTER